jgi:hypothetical protein
MNELTAILAGIDGDRLICQPQWVRKLVDDLARVARRRGDQIAQLTRAPEGTTTWADSNGTPKPVGRNPHIKHDMDSGRADGMPDSFVIQCESDGIEIRGDGLGRRFSIEPLSSNAVRLRWRDTR